MNQEDINRLKRVSAMAQAKAPAETSARTTRIIMWAFAVGGTLTALVVLAKMAGL